MSWTSLKTDENFDIVFGDDGIVATVEDATSVANMMKLDFASNSDWTLDYDLGLNWIKEDNNGLLQIKDSEILIVSAIQTKLLGLEGVKEIKEIEISRTLSRQLKIRVVVVAYDGSEFEIRNEV
ncbi:MAG: hypothetical protein RR744_00015 [Cellulosilyticaceae bacterium]